MMHRPGRFLTKWEVKKLNSSKFNKLSPEEEMELINKYTRSPLDESQVYVFSVTLCDNEVDRDFERFSVASLNKLKDLFLGKTGLFDHSMSSKDQSARVFYTYVEADPTQKNSVNETYTALKARAYMLRTKKNAELIDEIEAGIKKEVSVGCAVKSCICSVCGKDMKKHQCEHIKGRFYSGKLCYGTLENVSDAYEWSFVAVPAQRNAGVTKAFIKKEEENLKTANEIIKGLCASSSLSDSEVELVKSYVEQLEKQAQDAEFYRKHLIKDIERYSLIVMPKVNTKHLVSGCESMSLDKLKTFKEELYSQSLQCMPARTQLRHTKSSDNKDYTQYKI